MMAAQTQGTVANYETIYAELSAFLNEGFAAVEGGEYAVGRDIIEGVEVYLEVSASWAYQFTLYAGNEVYQTRDLTDAAHALHYAAHWLARQMSEVEF